MSDPIVKILDLACTPAHAFDVFVHQMSRWWPLASHSVADDRAEVQPRVAVEPRVGGRVLETRADGSTSSWGEVLAFAPPGLFAMSWHPGTDPARPTRVEVRFEARGAGGTRVTLTHSGWEIWAADAPEKRGNYVGGWDFVFGQCFRAAA